MFRKIKDHLYFIVAQYFRHWALIQLSLWKPRVVVVTGSNGKTTLLHLLEAQFQTQARYSHHANSTYGIPFDILGLKRKTFSPWEWVGLFVLAPIRAWKTPPKEKIYIVEADAERPGEGRFLSALLQPEVAVWLSCARTHSQQFDTLVATGIFANVDEAIAYEFGYFVERTQKLVLAQADDALIDAQRRRVTAAWRGISHRESLQQYAVTKTGTHFQIHGMDYHFPYLLPQQTAEAIVAVQLVTQYFDQPFDVSFSHLVMPPGRSSLFSGIRNTTIIDSSYNANVASVEAILSMMHQLSAQNKWVILGDLVQQGTQEKEEHEKLATLFRKDQVDRIVLVGPRLAQFTLPKLRDLEQKGVRITSFIEPRDALDFLLESLTGNEVLLFKGARFLEGIIEHLLVNSADVQKLCRREAHWQRRRRQWSL